MLEGNVLEYPKSIEMALMESYPLSVSDFKKVISKSNQIDEIVMKNVVAMHAKALTPDLIEMIIKAKINGVTEGFISKMAAYNYIAVTLKAGEIIFGESVVNLENEKCSDCSISIKGNFSLKWGINFDEEDIIILEKKPCQERRGWTCGRFIASGTHPDGSSYILCANANTNCYRVGSASFNLSLSY